MYERASLVAQRIKHLPAMWETLVRYLGWEDPLEKEMATHSSILAWEIPWTEKPGFSYIIVSSSVKIVAISALSTTRASLVAQMLKCVPGMECRRPGFDPCIVKIPWRRKWQPTPVLLPGESHGGRSLVDRLQSMVSQRVGHD